MKPKLIIALALLTLLPVGLALWFGQQWLSNSQATYQSQFRQLIGDKLVSHEAQLQSVFSTYSETLLNDTAELPRTVNALRRLSSRHPLINHIALLDKKGELLFPNEKRTISKTEAAFLARSQPLWQSGEFFQTIQSMASDANRRSGPSPQARQQYQIRSAPAPESAAASFNADGMRPQDTEQKIIVSGWYSYYAGSNMRHMFYIQRAQDTLAIELNSARLKSELIAALPQADSEQNSRIQLRDSRDRVIYQWGAYPIADNTEQALLSFSLAAPLGSWKLLYFGEGLQNLSTTQNLFLWGFTLLLFIVLGTLSGYLYLEHRRELKLSQQRVSFVNQISHELKTPLTNVRMYAELAHEELSHRLAAPNDDDEDESLENEPSIGYLKVITEESERLTRLINNVLSFSHQQKQSNQLHPVATNVNELIHSVLAAFKPALEAKQISAELQLATISSFYLDKDAVEQVLINLIGNVEKYAADGKRMVLQSKIINTNGQPCLEIRVRDFGPGIAKTHQGKIFEAFYRGSNALTEGVSGSGIGLNLAKALCQQHGGDLRYQDAKPGAEFIATFKQLEG